MGQLNCDISDGLEGCLQLEDNVQAVLCGQLELGINHLLVKEEAEARVELGEGSLVGDHNTGLPDLLIGSVQLKLNVNITIDNGTSLQDDVLVGILHLRVVVEVEQVTVVADGDGQVLCEGGGQHQAALHTRLGVEVGRGRDLLAVHVLELSFSLEGIQLSTVGEGEVHVLYRGAWEGSLEGGPDGISNLQSKVHLSLLGLVDLDLKVGLEVLQITVVLEGHLHGAESGAG